MLVAPPQDNLPPLADRPPTLEIGEKKKEGVKADLSEDERLVGVDRGPVLTSLRQAS